MALMFVSTLAQRRLRVLLPSTDRETYLGWASLLLGTTGVGIVIVAGESYLIVRKELTGVVLEIKI